jgi:hypothetical protein
VSCVRASGVGKLVAAISVQRCLGGEVGGRQVFAGGAMVAARAVLGSSRLRCRACGGGGLLSLVESVWSGWYFGGKLPLSWQWWHAFGASFFPAEGTIEGYHDHAAHGSRGENPVLFGRATTVPLALCPSWRHRIWRPAYGSGGGRLVVLPTLNPKPQNPNIPDV